LEESAVELLHTITADRVGYRLADFLSAEREETRVLLRTHGALLFRGFNVGGVDGFADVVTALSGKPLSYEERSSPRHSIKGNIYTSTDYPAAEEIFFHNENSYQTSWPMALYFYCVQPPSELGATPLASTRQVLKELDPDVLAEFRRRQWRVVRNFDASFGLSWQEVFNTTDRDQVTRYCAEHSIDAEWRGDVLRTIGVRDAVHRHPTTGEEVWFNHAAFFHVSTLPEEIGGGLVELFGLENLPSNTYFGDGAVIPDDMVAHIRDCYRAASVRFDYQVNDVIVIDNMLASHGREPYSGPRKIAVAMAEPTGVASRLLSVIGHVTISRRRADTCQWVFPAGWLVLAAGIAPR
jgi:alpha-ketoglutarate-dependent taurine dioxygenase